MLFSSGVITSLIIGALAGWIAGRIMESEGSLFRNIVLGVIGGVVGTAIFNFLGFHTYKGFGYLVASVVGSCIIIFLGRKLS